VKRDKAFPISVAIVEMAKKYILFSFPKTLESLALPSTLRNTKM
jgi:hypothetical protein